MKRRVLEDEGTKEKVDERAVARGPASPAFVVELMTGIKESEDYRDLCSPSVPHPSIPGVLWESDSIRPKIS